jgi:putative intracellular protease/amidase
MVDILIVIPHDGFLDEELKAVYDSLKKTDNEVDVGSTHYTEARGHYGLLIKPDVNIQYVETNDYDCIIFIGGRGIEEFTMDNSVLSIIKNGFDDRKLLCAIGMAVEIFAYAGILSSRKVTCDTSTIPIVEGAGAFYTGRLVEQDGELITASGADASQEFADHIIRALEWRDQRKGTLR